MYGIHVDFTLSDEEKYADVRGVFKQLEESYGKNDEDVFEILSMLGMVTAKYVVEQVLESDWMKAEGKDASLCLSSLLSPCDVVTPMTFDDGKIVEMHLEFDLDGSMQAFGYAAEYKDFLAGLLDSMGADNTRIDIVCYPGEA